MAFRRKAHNKEEPDQKSFYWSNETRNPMPKPDPAKRKQFAPKRPRLRKPKV